MASSKRVVNNKDARSRSIQLNRAQVNNLPYKNGNSNELAKHSLDVNNQKNHQRIPSLSNSSTSSRGINSNGEDLCQIQNHNVMNKTDNFDKQKGYDVRSHKINMADTKAADGQQVSIMQNSPSKFSLNKMSVGSSRNLRYQQQEEEFLDDDLKDNNQPPLNKQNIVSSSGEVFNYDADKSKEELPKLNKLEADKKLAQDMKIEVISTMVISSKKEKPKKEKKKKLDDKKGSVVQNNEVFNKAFDLIKTAE